MAFERISLNIIPEGEMPVFHVSQFDTGRPIIIDLYNGDDAYTPAAGVTFELHCRKVDDNIVTLDTYEVDGNTITFASTEQLCACSGDNLCEVAIMLDDLLMGTLNFILHVERDPLAGGLTSETSIYNLTQQIDDIISGEGYVKDTDLEILQSDWNETDVTSPAYIKNKPGPALADQADWTETDPLKQSYIKHKPTLATVATSGDYDDLTNKPTIPAAQVQSDWNEADNTKVDYIKNKPDLSIYAQSSDLAAVATSGDYDDLLNKPSIPDAQVQSDWNQTNTGAVDYIKNKPYVPVYTENETPYQIRTAPAGNNRTLEKLIGVSCAFNQLVNSGDTSINTISGHKYVTKINNVWLIIAGGSAVTIVDDSSDMVIDLTAMFGSEGADYLYTLESNTAGSGINLFRQLFPEDYYAYQTATLISSKPVSKVIKDSNDQTIATYPLGGDELRGLLKVENGQLVAYGDIHPSDGNGTEVFDIVDLGDCTWGGGSEVSGKNLFTVAISNFKRPIATTALPNAIVGGFDIKTQTDAPSFNNVYSGLSWFDGLAFWTSDYTAAQREQLKSDMSGVYLIYEKATPTAKSYTPFTNPMLCGSTEEFTDSRSVKMFCGHDSLYYNSPFKGW